jgi:preprotein translocase subunit SecE
LLKKEEKMAKASPIEFARQVRAEIKKITWPTKQETTVSTIAVFIMVVIAAIFLFVADQVMALGVQTILNLGL